jgi:hypothetical protein
MFDTISQIIISVLGCSGIFLISRPEKWSKYGFCCGAIAEPFWLYTLFIHHQYCIIPLSLFYFYSYNQGIYYRFIKHGQKK